MKKKRIFFLPRRRNEVRELKNVNENRNLLLVLLAVLILAFVYFVFVRPAGATFNYPQYGEWSECVPNEGNDCEETGGTKTRDVTNVEWVCPDGYSPFLEGKCIKWFGYIPSIKEKVKKEYTYQETEDCELSQESVLTCEEPPVEEPTCTGECGTPTDVKFADAGFGPPAVCSAPVPPTPSNPLVWRNGDQAIVQWVPSVEVDKAIVYWRENSQTGWQHSLTTVNNGYVVINGLGTMDFTFGVAQFNGCVPSRVIEVVDGMPTGWTMFTP